MQDMSYVVWFTGDGGWVYFFGHRPNIFEVPKKQLSQFGHNVWKSRLVNTVTASFNTVTGQMTEMSQRKKSRMLRNHANKQQTVQTQLVRSIIVACCLPTTGDGGEYCKCAKRGKCWTARSSGSYRADCSRKRRSLDSSPVCTIRLITYSRLGEMHREIYYASFVALDSIRRSISF